MYLKAIHIIFIVTWFAGLFYMPRLFIYNTEAEQKPKEERLILHAQFELMMRRLWSGITIPSGLVTLIIGPVLMFQEGWDKLVLTDAGRWLFIKLIFVLLLYIYFYSLHRIFLQQMAGIYKYSSQQLRIWNEVSTVFLIAITMLAVVKQSISLVWGLVGLLLLIILLMIAINIYKKIRLRK